MERERGSEGRDMKPCDSPSSEPAQTAIEMTRQMTTRRGRGNASARSISRGASKEKPRKKPMLVYQPHLVAQPPMKKATTTVRRMVAVMVTLTVTAAEMEINRRGIMKVGQMEVTAVEVKLMIVIICLIVGRREGIGVWQRLSVAVLKKRVQFERTLQVASRTRRTQCCKCCQQGVVRYRHSRVKLPRVE